MKWRWILALLLAFAACSCSSLRSGKPRPLRVGITPNYPPLIMKQGGKAAGVECDFAVQLASELNRPLQLLPIPWELILEELEAGRLDMVMSGLSITPAREVRVAFCNPYMDNPLVAVVRQGEAGNFPSANSIIGGNHSIGVLRDSAADIFVRKACLNARVLTLSSPEDVVFYLANQRIDLYIDDLAAAVDLVTRNENRLDLVRIPLESQEIAWAVQLGDEPLLRQANDALAHWQKVGLVNQILDRWMPYLKDMAGTGLN